MDNDIENLGKGVAPDPTDPRDFLFEEFMGASPVDFSVGFRLPEPPDENQQTSDACTSYSVSYLHWQIKGKNFSRRDVFSRIALQYGAYLRDAVKALCTSGQQTRDECGDPQTPTEQNMRVRCADQNAGIDDLEASYFMIQSNTIDAVAQAIRDHHGCIFGVYGNNIGWQDWRNPVPPANQAAIVWAHAVYGFGYHIHGGQKCIIAKSSWGRFAAGEGNAEHHIKENYFNQGMTFNAWVVIPKEQIMFPAIKVKYISAKGTSYGILVETPDTTLIVKADTNEEFAKMGKGYGVVTANPDGSANFDNAKEIDVR